MMEMSGMSIAMMLGMGVIWLIVLVFLVLGIAMALPPHRRISTIRIDRSASRLNQNGTDGD
jgi:hypothetical protein